MVDTSIKAIQCLILVPTRELALQYVSEIADIARRIDVKPFAVYGGFSMQTQLAKLAHGVDILVATPGRLIDLLYNTPLSLADVRTFVLDEADEMLTMGFISDVELILSCLIHEHQSLLFCATMPKKIENLAKRYLKDPLIIYMGKKRQTPKSLKHHFMQTHPRHRRYRLSKPRSGLRPRDTRHQLRLSKIYRSVYAPHRPDCKNGTKRSGAYSVYEIRSADIKSYHRYQQHKTYLGGLCS